MLRGSKIKLRQLNHEVSVLPLMLQAAGTLPNHAIVGSFESPIPLWMFLVASGVTVFGSALFSSVKPLADTEPLAASHRTIPRWIIRTLSVAGPIAIGWVVIQGVIGGSSLARVDVLFLWLAGWVLLPILAGFGLHLYPIVDPWRRAAIKIRTGSNRTLPDAAVPPTLIGVGTVAAIIALELVWTGGNGGPALLAALLVHGVWVVTGRIASEEPEIWAAKYDPLTIVNNFMVQNSRWQLVGDPDNGLVRRETSRPSMSTSSTFLLASLLVGAVIYDGLSQTEFWFRTFGLPTATSRAVLLLVVVGVVGLLSMLTTRFAQRKEPNPTSARSLVIAGLRPVALGYVIAHYGPSVLAAAPYVLVAVADPLQRGWNLFGLAFAASGLSPLPGAIIWAGQVIAVVGGHIVGIRATHTRSEGRQRSQWAATILLVALTMLTLWTLGQSVVKAG